MADQQNAKLPSPIDVFSPDERIARVQAIESALLAEHGQHYAHNDRDQLQYFGSHIDARYWRHLKAVRVVREEERIAKLAEAYENLKRRHEEEADRSQALISELQARLMTVERQRDYLIEQLDAAERGERYAAVIGVVNAGGA